MIFAFYRLPAKLHNKFRIPNQFAPNDQAAGHLYIQSFRDVWQFCAMVLIDTHAHLFGDSFAQDQQEVFQRAAASGLKFVLLPNIDAQSIPFVVDAIQQNPIAKPMWGLHPCHVFQNWRVELEVIEDQISTFPPVAIGEIGLDYYWSRDYVDYQIEALRFQLEMALRLNLPVSLHTRNATREVIEMVEPYSEKGLNGVFHCFSGTKEEAEEIIAMGFKLGIGGTITFKNNPVSGFLGTLPLDSVVLETDTPYLAPVPYRGKRNEPSYLVHVASALAGIFETDTKEIAERTSATANQIFKLF